MPLGRRALLSCVLLPGSLRPWCGEEPVDVKNGEWTGYPPDPRVSGWHLLGLWAGDDGPGLPLFWDAGVMAWRYDPKQRDAMSAAEIAADEKVYRGPYRPRG